MEADPVRRHTSPALLRDIQRRIEENVRFYSMQPPDVLSQRLTQLRREWSMERTLQLNVSAAGLATALLALTKNRKWAVLTCAALGFFLYHAIEGYDPLIPILRRLGVRTRREIDRELYALKAARGDFRDVPEGRTADQRFAAEILDSVNK